MLNSSSAGDRRTNVPGCSNACLIRFTLPYYIKPPAASNRRGCWISAVGAGDSCGKCMTIGRRHTFVGSIQCCDLVAAFFSLFSPPPPRLHGCFHVFSVQRRCVCFLNRRVWMYRRSQVLLRALCVSPSVRR